MIKLLIIIPFKVLTAPSGTFHFNRKNVARKFRVDKRYCNIIDGYAFEKFLEKNQIFLFTTVALAAVCLRCVCVARYRTTSENSGSRGKRKGSRGKCRGATKTNAFVVVDAFFNTHLSYFRLYFRHLI